MLAKTTATFFVVFLLAVFGIIDAARVCKVDEYGAKCLTHYDEPVDSAPGILAAMEACKENSTTPAGLVTFDEGDCHYLFKPFVLPENSRLNVDGAPLVAMEPSDPQAFVDEYYSSYHDPNAVSTPPGLITMKTGSKILSLGSGVRTINGNLKSPAWQEVLRLANAMGAPGPSVVRTDRVTDVTIRNVRILNAAGAAVNVSQSKRVTISGIDGEFDFPAMNGPEVGGLYIWGSSNVNVASDFETHPTSYYGQRAGIVVIPDTLTSFVGNIMILSNTKGVRLHVPAYGGVIHNISIVANAINAHEKETIQRSSRVRSRRVINTRSDIDVNGNNRLLPDPSNYTTLLYIDTTPGARGKISDVSFIGGISDVMLGPALIIDQWGGKNNPPGPEIPAVTIGSVEVSNIKVGRASTDTAGIVKCVPESCPEPIIINNIVRSTTDGVPKYTCFNAVLQGTGNEPALPSSCTSTK